MQWFVHLVNCYVRVDQVPLPSTIGFCVILVSIFLPSCYPPNYQCVKSMIDGDDDRGTLHVVVLGCVQASNYYLALVSSECIAVLYCGCHHRQNHPHPDNIARCQYLRRHRTTPQGRPNTHERKQPLIHWVRYLVLVSIY